MAQIFDWKKLVELLQISKHEFDDFSKPSKIAQKYVVASIHYQLNKLKKWLWGFLRY
jgi:hypothetical protein